jgi:hypothetical protein
VTRHVAVVSDRTAGHARSPFWRQCVRGADRRRQSAWGPFAATAKTTEIRRPAIRCTQYTRHSFLILKFLKGNRHASRYI